MFLLPPVKNGFLHKNDFWTFKFDNGKLFRGIGENVCWESRTFDDSKVDDKYYVNQKYTYDYFLSSLSKNGANFFRTWMCTWNLPLEWGQVENTNRYTNSNEYFNPSGIKRMDELVAMADSLGMYFMLTLDFPGTLSGKGYWLKSPYNKANGGPALNPQEFFTSSMARSRYKNKLRYIIARWGYSTSIAAFEFFNEIDHVVFGPGDSVVIPHPIITQWHDDMGMYLKNTDPYGHMVTTSVSHRDIMGLNQSAYIDFNQKHIYKHTDKVMGTIKTYSEEYNKPYVIGECGYEWDWNLDFSKIATECDYDYKRALWYGLFCQTPILPMSWWWEFFDQRGMTSYFRGVRQISDQMLASGNGSFEYMDIDAGHLEAYSVKCGNNIYVYLLNNTKSELRPDLKLSIKFNNNTYKLQSFDPVSLDYKGLGTVNATNKELDLKNISLEPKKEMILIFTKL